MAAVLRASLMAMLCSCPRASTRVHLALSNTRLRKLTVVGGPIGFRRLLDDQGFTPQQAAGWRTAETALGIGGVCSSGPAARGSTTSSPVTPTPTAGQPFVGHKGFAGSIHSYVFKLGPARLGYYLHLPLRHATDNRTITLDTLIPPNVCTGSSDALARQRLHGCRSKKPARHARLPDGRRRPWKPWHKRSATVTHGRGIPTDSPVGGSSPPNAVPTLGEVEVEDRWWAQRGCWAIETCNGNSWGSLKQAILERSKADIILAQETKLFSPSATNTGQRQPRRLGWNPILAKAHQAALHHGSGGGAILARSGIGIAPGVDELILNNLKHRTHIA